MDGRQQQHALVDGDGRGERQRQRHGRVQRVGERRTRAPRTGTITIGGQTFTVTQAAAALHVCDRADESVGRSPAAARARRRSRRWPAARGPASATTRRWLTVTAGRAAAATARSRSARRRIASTQPRTGTLTIGGPDVHRDAGRRGVHVRDRADESVGRRRRRHRVDERSRRPPAARGRRVSNNTPWLTVTSGASGSGNGTVGFSASPPTTRHASAPAR